MKVVYEFIHTIMYALKKLDVTTLISYLVDQVNKLKLDVEKATGLRFEWCYQKITVGGDDYNILIYHSFASFV